MLTKQRLELPADTLPQNAQSSPEGVYDYGFSIQRVEPFADYGQKLPLDTVLASDAQMADDFEERMRSHNGVRLLGPNEDAKSDEFTLRAFATVRIPQVEYDKRVAQDQASGKPNPLETNRLFGPEPHFTVFHYPGRGQFNNALSANLYGAFPEYEEKSVRDAIRKAAAASAYEADFKALPPKVLEQMDGVTQVFEFEADGFVRRLYNFTETLVDDRQLAEMANALRTVADKTGGSSTRHLTVMAIVPEVANYVTEETDLQGKTALALERHGAVLLGEKLFTKDQTPKGRKRHDDYSVGGAGLELTLFHELAHVVEAAVPSAAQEAARQLGWELQGGGLRDSKAIKLHRLLRKRFAWLRKSTLPSKYAAEDPVEHIAENAAALHAGGKLAARIGHEGRAAIGGIYYAAHSGRQGPSYVRVREVDLTKLTKKFGSDLAADKIAVETNITYKIV